jgi:major membrane immunogen (membrane-anchored lipoprotein)
MNMKKKFLVMILGSVLLLTSCGGETEEETSEKAVEKTKSTHTEIVATERDYTVRVEKTDDGDIVRIEKAYTELDSSGNFKREVFWEDETWYR